MVEGRKFIVHGSWFIDGFLRSEVVCEFMVHSSWFIDVCIYVDRYKELSAITNPLAFVIPQGSMHRIKRILQPVIQAGTIF